MDDAFTFLMNMQSVTNDTPDLSICTSLRGMFAHSRFNSNIDNWDVSNITDMSLMFFQAQDFNQSLNSWDVGSVQYFNSMFNHATAFNGGISNWNLASASNLNNLFNNATSFDQDISNWDTSNVINMQGVFAGATSFNQPLDNWDVSSVTDFSLMFAESSFNLPITSWNTQSATNMRAMFAASVFNQPINHFDTCQVIDMVGMFFFNDAFNQNLDNWDTSQVTDMSMMFNDATAFNQNLNSWNVENLNQAADMLTNSDIGINNYTQLLQSWSQQTVNNNVTLSVGPQYCQAAQQFRDILTNTYGWIIIDGGVDTSANCTLGIEELEQSTFELYPNPATNQVSIDCNEHAFAKAELYNLQGQRVAYFTTSSFSVRKLKTGMYIVQVTTVDGQRLSERFIKR
ncbi:MAG: BspA family leucine-rich repeat surface protein [Nonlabens sp.]